MDISHIVEDPLRIEVGVENRNYVIRAKAGGEVRDYILRCPPEELPEWRKTWDLYDLRREFDTLVRLPVLSLGYSTPMALGYDEGGALGLPCFLMERLPGKSFSFNFEPGYGETHIAGLAAAVAVVTNIEVPVDSWFAANLPLRATDAELGWLRSQAAGHENDPLVAYALDWLEEHKPPPRRLVMCHGDPNATSFLAQDGVVTGVVDWEFACLRDDGLCEVLCVGWLQDMPELKEVFCRAQGRDVSELMYYEAKGLFGLTYVDGRFGSKREKLADLVQYCKR